MTSDINRRLIEWGQKRIKLLDEKDKLIIEGAESGLSATDMHELTGLSRGAVMTALRHAGRHDLIWPRGGRRPEGGGRII